MGYIPLSCFPRVPLAYSTIRSPFNVMIQDMTRQAYYKSSWHNYHRITCTRFELSAASVAVLPFASRWTLTYIVWKHVYVRWFVFYVLVYAYNMCFLWSSFSPSLYNIDDEPNFNIGWKASSFKTSAYLLPPATIIWLS